MIKAVLFDIDGVLLDTKDALALFYSDVLAKYGYSKPSQEKIDGVLHLTVRDALADLTREKSKQKLADMYDYAMGRSSPYPFDMVKRPRNLEKVLKTISSKYTLGVVTSRTRQFAESQLRNCQIIEYFKIIVSCDEVKKPKPDPEPLLFAFRKLGVKPDECVYIGDRPSDFMSAKGAKTNFVVYGSALSMWKHRASSFDQLEKAIESFGK